MARSVSQTLAMAGTSISLSSKSRPVPIRLLKVRNRSNQPERLNPVEVELGPDAEMERIALKKLEDVIHRIIMKKSEPNWLPFVPGGSYWVPPKSKARGFAEVIGKLASSSMSKDEALSLTNNRGWPSSAYYLKGASPSTPEGETNSKHTSQSEDEEG